MTDIIAILRLGFGAVDARTLMASDSLPSDIAKLALIANSPQIMLSLLYFAYNSLLTAMLMGYEWRSYAFEMKGLRVSRRPSGFQRSTCFLQLLHRFETPLVVVSGTLHWLVSQSIFVGAIDNYSSHDGLGVAATKTCGYSPVALLSVILLSGLLLIAIISLGNIPYKGGIPVAGSLSMAINAACHPGQPCADSGLLSEQKLQWVVVNTSADGIGHCAFSNKEVGVLVEEHMYN